jgi:hypothetical protein
LPSSFLTPTESITGLAKMDKETVKNDMVNNKILNFIIDNRSIIYRESTLRLDLFLI